MNEQLNNESVSRVVEFVCAEIERYAGYHRHKESMAYTGVALFTGIAGYVLTSKNLPPEVWCCYGQLFGVLALVGLWAVMLLYLRFQCQRRRWAALRVAGCERVLVRWTTSKLDLNRMGAAQRPSIVEPALWRKVLDWIWPQKMCTPVIKESQEDYYPQVLVDAWVEVEESGTAAIEHERLIFVTGWTLFFLMLFRTLWL